LQFTADAPDSHASSILFPLYQTSTFVHDAVGVDKGFSYSRVSNPTVDALEKAIGALEGTPPAVCFRTGIAAISTLFLSVLKSGDHVVVSDVVYGGTMRLFREVLDYLGITASFVDSSDAGNVEAAITPATRMVFIETPGNPTLKLTDIEAVAQIAKRHSILLAVDNTFLTPILQKPLELGADISVLSTTKYIDGHNATVAEPYRIGHTRQCARNLRRTQALMEMIDHGDPQRVAGNQLARDARLDRQQPGAPVGGYASVPPGNGRSASMNKRWLPAVPVHFTGDAGTGPHEAGSDRRRLHA